MCQHKKQGYIACKQGTQTVICQMLVNIAWWLYCETWKMFHCWRYLFRSGQVPGQALRCTGQFRRLQPGHVDNNWVKSYRERSEAYTRSCWRDEQQLPHSQHQPLLGHIIDKFTGEWALYHWADVCKFTSGFIPESKAK